MKNLFTSAATTALFIALIGAATPVLAASSTAGALPQRVVVTTGLDLSTQQGMKALYGRLERAAATLCPPGGRDPARAALARSCQQQVLDAAVKQSGMARLATVHRGRAAL